MNRPTLGNYLLKGPLFILVILAVTFITLWSILVTAQKLEQESKRNLERELSGVLKTTHGALHFWLEEIKQDQESMAQLPQVRSLIEKNFSAKELRIFYQTLEPIAKAHGYLGYAVYRKDIKGHLKKIAEHQSFKSDLLKPNQMAIKALAGEFVLGPATSIDKNHLISISATPIYNSIGKVLGVITFNVNLLPKFIEATMLGRMGESGETYAVDEKGYLLTGSRFGPGPMMLKSPIFYQQSRGHNLMGYPDYRGVKVIGAWEWDQEFSLGLITEIDYAEAFRSFIITQRLVWILITLVIIISGLILLAREIWTRNKISLLQQKEEARKELLSIVSHDLKNPLSTILMSNQILLRNNPNVMQVNILKRAARAIDEMKMLISDLLDTSRIEEGFLSIHPVKCHALEVVRKNIDSIEESALKKEIMIHNEIRSLPPLYADPSRLSQIFANLLTNAIKFSYQGGEVTLSAKVLENFVEFQIQDNGPGISLEEQVHLFERFYQAEAGKGIGTGLGLSICKELVLAHHGDIWVNSEVGRGSTFYFTIPRFKEDFTSEEAHP
ncbi:MAG: ATP-binding protein [Bacteriovoracaceae bacterium]